MELAHLPVQNVICGTVDGFALAILDYGHQRRGFFAGGGRIKNAFKTLCLLFRGCWNSSKEIGGSVFAMSYIDLEVVFLQTHELDKTGNEPQLL